MPDEPILDQIWHAIAELKRRDLEPTAVYLGGHEYTTLRSSEGFRHVCRRGDDQETVLGVPLFRVTETRHLAVVHSPS